MVNWPVPKNIRQLRGFLGLMGFYRSFIKNKASISLALTELLKKMHLIGIQRHKIFLRIKNSHDQSTGTLPSRFHTTIYHQTMLQYLVWGQS